MKSARGLPLRYFARRSGACAGPLLLVLLACKLTQSSSGTGEQPSPPPAVDEGPNATPQSGGVLPADAERTLRVTGGVVRRTGGAGDPTSTDEPFPAQSGDRICVTNNRTSERGCKTLGGTDIRLRVRTQDLTRSGTGLKVELFGESGSLGTIEALNFPANSVKPSSRGYAFPVTPAITHVHWGNHAGFVKVLAFLE
jgi:hypothetical protein